jgi:hypothetical protein
MHTNQEATMPTDISTIKLRTLTLALPAGRVLHIALVFDAAGEPEDIVLADGFEGGTGLRELSKGLCIPASVLPGLTGAFAALHGDS